MQRTRRTSGIQTVVKCCGRTASCQTGVLLATLAVGLAVADPALAATQVGHVTSTHGETIRLWQLADAEPDFWVNMERYARFAVGTSIGMFWSVAKPLVDLLRTPQTAVLLIVGVALSTKLITWTLNASTLLLSAFLHSRLTLMTKTQCLDWILR